MLRYLSGLVCCCTTAAFAQSMQDPHSSTLHATRTPRNVEYVANPAADALGRAQDSVAGLQWMQPADRDVTHYSPRMCLNAIETIDRITRTRFAYDTIVPGSRADTVGSAARAYGKSCMARRPLSSVMPPDLDAYSRAALALGDDALAMAAIQRRVHEAPNDSAKASVLLDALVTAEHAHPTRLELADTLVRQLDGLGPRVEVWKLIGRRQYGTMVQTAVFDTTRALAILTPYLQRLRALSNDNRQYAGEWTQGSYVSARLYADVFARLPVDTIAYHYARGWMNELEETMVTNREINLEVSKQEAYGRFSVQEGQLLREAMRRRDTPVGTYSTDGFWFSGSNDTVPAETALGPTPGRVTLVISVTRVDGSVDREKAAIRRLYDRYTKDGLDIILVNNTRGYAWHSPPLEPRDEAKVVAWYVHDVCELPVPLVVFNTPVRIAPDSTRQYNNDTVQAYGYHLADYGVSGATDPMAVLLIDRKGREYVSSSMTWIVLEAEIRQALGLPPEYP